MMARTQITLHRESLRRAKRRAADLGVSLAEYIRQLVDRDLAAERPVADPAQVFGLGDSGGSDVRRDKDAMIERAFAADRGAT